jgi:nucleotide-binding universal stress UspA family protein
MTASPISKILVATDFSTCARRALDYAAFLAGACSVPVELLHVIDILQDSDFDSLEANRYFDYCRKQAEKPLDEMAAFLVEAGLVAKCRLRRGIPSQQINDVAADCRADLVVLGSHGRTGLAHIVLGSTAERVVRGAPCPVLIVREGPDDHRLMQDQRSGTTPAVSRILTPVDFSPCSLDALDYAAGLAQVFRAAITILYVMEPVFFDLDLAVGRILEEPEKREQAQSRLAGLVERLTPRGLSIQSAVRGGITTDSILACALGCDLIVMGTHGQRGHSELRTGSIAEAVLRRAQCPVLTVKSFKGSDSSQLAPSLWHNAGS